MTRRRLLIPAFVALAVAFAACAGPGSTFDPTGPCRADGKRAGAYPILEARIPRTYDGRNPDRLDSGRNCSVDNLATLASHGVTEVRFAGGVWGSGSRSGITLALFQATGLQSAWMGEFYEAGARAARHTENVSNSTVTIDGVELTRLDTLNDQSFQTVLVLPVRAGDLVPVAIVATDVRDQPDRSAHEARLVDAVEAWSASP